MHLQEQIVAVASLLSQVRYFTARLGLGSTPCYRHALKMQGLYPACMQSACELAPMSDDGDKHIHCWQGPTGRGRRITNAPGGKAIG